MCLVVSGRVTDVLGKVWTSLKGPNWVWKALVGPERLWNLKMWVGKSLDGQEDSDPREKKNS